MARPKNLLVTKNGVVFSMTPKALEAVLKAIANGTETPASGKVVGSLSLDVTGMTAAGATSALASLFPTPVETVPFRPVTTEPEDLSGPDVVEIPMVARTSPTA